MNVSQVLSCKNIDEIKRFFRSQLYVCLPQLYVFSFWSQRRAYAPLWFPHNNHLVGFQQTSRFAFRISQIKTVRLPVEWTSALIQSADRSKTLYKTCHIHIRGQYLLSMTCSWRSLLITTWPALHPELQPPPKTKTTLFWSPKTSLEMFAGLFKSHLVLMPQIRVEMSPGVLKNIQWFDSSSVGRLVGCNNAAWCEMVSNKRITWRWCAAFGTNFNLARHHLQCE